MKLSMQLTLDGLVRAMRGKAHEVAEAVESGALTPEGETRRENPAARRKEDSRDRRDP